MTEEEIYDPKYENSWALVIGIDNYNKMPPLEHAVSDAKAIAKILTEQCEFPEENITLLTENEATSEKIRQAFSRYTKDDVNGDDRILVFFSGHGHTLQGKRGPIGYLVPQDGRLEDINTLIRWSALTDDAELIVAKHIFFIMDACYGGLALSRSPSGGMRFGKSMLARYSRQVLTAGKGDEKVADGGGVLPDHSIFTAHLLTGLSGDARTKEGLITANGLMAYVYDKVGHDSHSKQTPNYGPLEGSGDFVFNPSTLLKLQEKAEKGYSKDQEGGEPQVLVHTSSVGNKITSTNDNATSMIQTFKRLLPDAQQRIVLEDTVNEQIKLFLETTDVTKFPLSTPPFTQNDFVSRVSEYERLTKNLQEIVILLVRWSTDENLVLIKKILTRAFSSRKEEDGSRITGWLQLIWYPLYILTYSAGITALYQGKYDILSTILRLPVPKDNYDKENKLPLIVGVGSKSGSLQEVFKTMPGLEQRLVPLSEHLLTALQPVLEDILFLGEEYEQRFDEFEAFRMLIFAYETKMGWGPPGRFAWKHREYDGIKTPLRRIIEEAEKMGKDWPPLKVGMFGGKWEDFVSTAKECEERINRLGWF